MISETARQAYLKAMGVQVYFPRTVLEGAKPSPDYDLPAPEAPVHIPTAEKLPQAAGPVQATPNRADAQRSRNPDRPVIDLGSTARTRPEQRPSAPAKHVFRHQAAPAAAVSNSGDAEASSLRFDLGYWALGEGAAILYELPPLASDLDKARARTLLAAIVEACGFTNALPLPDRQEGLSWPLPNEFDLPSSDQAGAAALKGFLQRCRDRDQLRELIVFAGVVEPLLEKIGEELRVRQTLVASLSAMLSLASLKREVWVDLQPALARIRTPKP